jgi:hypothetical protein
LKLLTKLASCRVRIASGDDHEAHEASLSASPPALDPAKVAVIRSLAQLPTG